ncbi:MAG: preprotein translocase subunit SecY, partial [Sedimentibacter sp.]
MFGTLKNAWKIPDLRKRMIFTFLMLVVYRFGAVIPVPGIDKSVIQSMFAGTAGGLLDFFDMMSGGAFKDFTIFALNIYPYITASIILQLLAIAIPKLEQIFKAEDGRKKMAQWTRYVTVILALIQATAYSVGFFNSAIIDQSFLSIVSVVIVLTAGTSFLMWLGELITEKGIGNGISLIIMIGIVSRYPSDFGTMIYQLQNGAVSVIEILLFLVFALFIVVGVIAIQQGERKVPVQYAKRVVGRKMYGGQNTFIPMKVLMAGVMPVIFASTLLAIPQTMAFFFPSMAEGVQKYFSLSQSPGIYFYTILNIIFIIFFTYFYTAVQFNPFEYSTTLKENGGFIPGIRPGRPTGDYLNKVLNRITIAGAVAL